MQYQDWIQTWLTLYVKPTVKLRTYEKYTQIARSRIIPALGNCELEELTLPVLQQLVAELCGRLSSNSVNGTITVLRRSLRQAVALGVTKESFADGICRPRAQEKRVECFTPAEQQKIEKGAIRGKKKLFGILLCLYTGLRIGELLALEWSDIDLGRGLLLVQRSCHFGRDENGHYGRITEPPKTPHSERVIPLPRALLPYLRERKANADSPYVVSSHGKPIAPRSYQNSFALLLKHLGIPHRGFHALRHTFATRALESGMDVRTLSELLGHKNPTVTLHRYCHSLMEHKADMMNKLGKFCNLKLLGN